MAGDIIVVFILMIHRDHEEDVVVDLHIHTKLVCCHGFCMRGDRWKGFCWFIILSIPQQRMRDALHLAWTEFYLTQFFYFL